MNADGTAPKRVWESRKPPQPNQNIEGPGKPLEFPGALKQLSSLVESVPGGVVVTCAGTRTHETLRVNQAYNNRLEPLPGRGLFFIPTRRSIQTQNTTARHSRKDSDTKCLKQPSIQVVRVGFTSRTAAPNTTVRVSAENRVYLCQLGSERFPSSVSRKRL